MKYVLVSGGKKDPTGKIGDSGADNHFQVSLAVSEKALLV
jgi:hypothetical protein